MVTFETPEETETTEIRGKEKVVSIDEFEVHDSHPPMVSCYMALILSRLMIIWIRKLAIVESLW